MRETEVGLDLSDLVIEAAVVGTAIGWLSNEAFEHLQRVDASLFVDHAHAVVFDAARRLWERGETADPQTVRAELGLQGVFDQVGEQRLQEIVGAEMVPSKLPSYLRVLSNLAERRRWRQVALTLDEASRSGDRAAVERGLSELAATPLATAGAISPFLDWSGFWAKDRREAEWLFEDVLARGRGHSLFASHKAGKSLFMLWVALQLVSAGAVVVYLDYEMTEDDLYERLLDMGVEPGTELERLRYALLPSLPPLDEAAGARALLSLVDSCAASHPEADIVVIIDTTSRAVAGEENSADTIRAFYRWTGLSLKQRGATWARLDHAGKDATRGQRGSSAKGDDVDLVWKLGRTEDGIELKREVSRMGWVPERVAFHLETHPLGYRRVAAGWPAGTKETAELLDAVGVPLEMGERPAGKALREAGHKVQQSVIRSAIRWRRELATEGQ